MFKKKSALLLILLLLIPVTTYGTYHLMLHLRFSPSPPVADFSPPQSAREAHQQDLDYFRHFLSLDRSYTAQTRAQAEDILEDLERQLDSVSEAAFELAITRAVAVADNGHTNVWLGRMSHAHGRLPIRFNWFADGLYVVAAKSPYEPLLGRKIESVGGVAIDEAMQRLKAFAGGPWSGYRAYRGPALLELPSALHAAGLSDNAEQADLHFVGMDGDVVMDKVMLSEDEPLWWSHYYLAPNAPLPGWTVLEAPLPLFLQESGDLFRIKHLEEHDMLYVQFRANSGEGLDEMLGSVREALATHAPRVLVIDQRHNGGGDYTLTEPLMSDLPDLIGADTRVYVITGNATFSAGINSVAFAKAALGERMTIVGERIGDRERSFGETNAFELPNSNLGMTFNTGLHDVGAGCPPFPECYWRNYFHDVAVGSLDPDVRIEYTFDHFMQGVDPVLTYIVESG